MSSFTYRTIKDSRPPKLKNKSMKKEIHTTKTTDSEQVSGRTDPPCSVFRIRTITDIFNLPTVGQMKKCLEEMTIGMVQTRTTKDLIDEAVAAFGITAKSDYPEEFNWIDDGKGEIKTSISTEGEELGSIISSPNKQL